MKDWAEEIFLERLMPLMREQMPTQGGLCPEAELLCAFSEERIAAEEKRRVEAHLAGCARCRDLHSCLLAFATPAAKEDPIEWANVEKRLNNWMEITLRDQTQGDRSFHPQRDSNQKTPASNWWSTWRSGWAVGAFAAAAFALLAVLLLKPSARIPHEVQTAQATLPAQTTEAKPEAPQPVPSPTPGSTANAPLAEKSSAAKAVRAKPEEKHLPPPVTPSASTTADAPQITANAQPPGSDKSAEHAVIAAPADTGNASVASASNPTTTKPNEAVGAEGNPGSVPAAQAGHNQLATYGSNNLHSLPPARQPTTKQVSNLPASIRLEAGTRIWVRITSLVKHPDGTLTFAGSLFEPITRNGVVELAQGTGVRGYERQNQSSISLVITGVEREGARYTLKGATDNKGNPSHGGGKALQFDSGRIVEMFIESATVYERTTNSVTQPASR